jgi:hypothetical protein
MRIGQVNQENYKDFLKILGVKNPKGLEKLHGEGNGKKADGQNYYRSDEESIALAVKAGIVMEGMAFRDGDDSYKKIVDVPDWIRQKVIDNSREMVIANGNGSVTAEQGDKHAKIIKDYIKTLPPSERASAAYTLEKIGQVERQRIVDYLRAEIGWQAGQKFDTSILTKSNFGLNHMDIKA